MVRDKSFKVPKSVRAAAQKGLDLRKKYQRGGFDNRQAAASRVGSGVQRAKNLVKGQVSYESIRRMKAFFSRHQKNYRPEVQMDDGGPTAGTIAWQLWGGEPGRKWADQVMAQHETASVSTHPVETFVYNYLNMVRRVGYSPWRIWTVNDCDDNTLMMKTKRELVKYINSCPTSELGSIELRSLYKEFDLPTDFVAEYNSIPPATRNRMFDLVSGTKLPYCLAVSTSHGLKILSNHMSAAIASRLRMKVLVKIVDEDTMASIKKAPEIASDNPKNFTRKVLNLQRPKKVPAEPQSKSASPKVQQLANKYKVLFVKELKDLLQSPLRNKWISMVVDPSSGASIDVYVRKSVQPYGPNRTTVACLDLPNIGIPEEFQRLGLGKFIIEEMEKSIEHNRMTGKYKHMGEAIVAVRVENLSHSQFARFLSTRGYKKEEEIGQHTAGVVTLYREIASVKRKKKKRVRRILRPFHINPVANDTPDTGDFPPIAPNISPDGLSTEFSNSPIQPAIKRIK